MYYNQFYGISGLRLLQMAASMSLDAICSEFKRVLKTALTCKGNALVINFKSCQFLSDMADNSNGRRGNGIYKVL